MPIEEVPPQAVPCPALSRPESFQSLDELRRELHRANTLLIQQCDQLNAYRSMSVQMGRSMAAIMTAHMAGDALRLVQVLQDIQAKHVMVVAPGSGALQ